VFVASDPPPLPPALAVVVVVDVGGGDDEVDDMPMGIFRCACSAFAALILLRRKNRTQSMAGVSSVGRAWRRGGSRIRCSTVLLYYCVCECERQLGSPSKSVGREILVFAVVVVGKLSLSLTPT